jgi:hypothetical protein
VKGRFNASGPFTGSFASVFLNISSVESEFSVSGWEIDEYGPSLTDLCLEKMMQAKQKVLGFIDSVVYFHLFTSEF